MLAGMHSCWAVHAAENKWLAKHTVASGPIGRDSGVLLVQKMVTENGCLSNAILILIITIIIVHASSLGQIPAE